MRRLLLLGLTAFACASLCSFPESAPLAAMQKKKQPKTATTPEDLFVAEGFQVELVLAADPAVEGSFINMAFDGQGRLITSGQRGQAVMRFTLKDGKIDSGEKLNLPISEIMGILWANDSLYVNGAGPNQFGLYRCKETAPNQFEVKFLKQFAGSGEHGPHGLAQDPDGKIYIMNGNHTKLPDGLNTKPMLKNYREDHVLPRQWDGNGHAAGIYAPGGYVVRTDAEGKEWELVLGGFRNAYDIAFNGDGELFTFDSDMEWDWGMPWYRPTRVNHCVSGADFGWRSGTGVWPEYYPDNLPATVNIGIGSPTGVSNGIGAKFPAKYQKAMYMLDWTYGRVLAVHLKPDGASYSATFENFVCPLGLMRSGAAKKPFNVTDIAVGPDGAMYFTTGGRNTQGAIYRVTYTGKESTAKADTTTPDPDGLRKIRKELEVFHTKKDPKGVELALGKLDHGDRFIRYAARIALENQPIDQWKSKVLESKEPRGLLTGSLALARLGDDKDQAAVMKALDMPMKNSNVDLQLDRLRVYQVSFSRHGPPNAEMARKIITELETVFPNKDERINREAAQVLIFLKTPGIAAKCLKMMAEAKTQEDQFHYLFHLRTLPIGEWTSAQRKEYLTYFTRERKKLPTTETMTKWFADAGRGYGDGNSFNNFLKNFFKEAVANMSEAERKEHAALIASIDKTVVPSYDVPAKAFVKAWKMEDLTGKLDEVGKNRNVTKGRDAYFAGQCIKCHRIGTEGGAIGPDLTSIAQRFDRRAILESILEPSKVLSDQYQNETITTLTGKVFTGRIVGESEKTLTLQPNPLEPARIDINKADVDTRKPSLVSPMPANLADVLTAEEIFDLMAFLESGGKKK